MVRAIFILLLLLIGFANLLLAQSKRDYLQQEINDVELMKKRSIGSTKFSKIDRISTLPTKLAQFSDSLNPNLSKYNHKLDSIKGKLTHRIDSLQRLSLPTGQYTHLLDSIERAGPLKDMRQTESKLSSLERKLNEPAVKLNGGVNKIESRINQKLNLLNKEAGRTDRPVGRSGSAQCSVIGSLPRQGRSYPQY